jgi:hypothetical protein
MQVVYDGAGDTENVDAPVRFEVLILDGNDGLAKNGGESVVVDDDAMFESEGSEDLAVAIVEVGSRRRTEMLQLADLGQIGGVDDGQSGEGARDHGKQNENSERGAASNLAAAIAGKRRIDMRTRPMQLAKFFVPFRYAQLERLMWRSSQSDSGLISDSPNEKGYV